MKTTKQKAIYSVLSLIMALGLFFLSGLHIPLIDKTTEGYFGTSIKKAGVAYTTCRLINGSVSVIKDSDLQLEPAGVGVSLAVGQILDPIDDMTERLSDVLVTAIVSLGLQKLIYEISISLVPILMAILLLLLSLFIWFNSPRIRLIQKVLVRISFLLILLRFCLPLSSLANHFVQAHFFEEQVTQAQKELSVGTSNLDELNTFNFPESDGALETLRNSAAFVRKKSSALKKALSATLNNSGNIIENLLKLTLLYVGIFIIQVILMPLLIFWLIIKISNFIFPAHLSWILHHKKVSEGASPES